MDFPYWPASIGSIDIALAYVPSETTEYLLFVGTDQGLHAVTVDVTISAGDGTGSVQPSWAFVQGQDTSSWPMAAAAGASLATACDLSTNGSEMRVYYTASDGDMVEAAYHAGTWGPARVVIPAADLVEAAPAQPQPPGKGSNSTDPVTGTTSNGSGNDNGAATSPKPSGGMLAGIIISALCAGSLAILAVIVLAYRTQRWWVERRRDPLRGIRVNTARARRQGRQLYFAHARPYDEDGPLRSMETTESRPAQS
jgi:hypothetical protein